MWLQTHTNKHTITGMFGNLKSSELDGFLFISSTLCEELLTFKKSLFTSFGVLAVSEFHPSPMIDMTGPMVHTGLQQLYTHAMGYRMLEFTFKILYRSSHCREARHFKEKQNTSVSILTSMSKKLDHILSLLIMHLTIVQIQCTSPH